MDSVLMWCAFLGAWLLVAGPIYQAAIELADEEFEREDLHRAYQSIEPVPPVSAWWLLIPPVAWWLNHRRREATRHALLHALEPVELEQFMHYSETATAWMFVASGAFLLAVRETWDLCEHYDWPAGTFWGLTVLLIALCTANTGLRFKRRRDILAQVTGST